MEHHFEQTQLPSPFVKASQLSLSLCLLDLLENLALLVMKHEDMGVRSIHQPLAFSSLRLMH